MSKKQHKQTWVKVNAPVDKDVAGLIQALNLFPKLQTIESCRGDYSKTKNSWIWVSFQYGLSWQDLSQFVFGYLGVRLASSLGDRIDISIRVTEAGLHIAELYVHPDSLEKTVRVVKLLSRRFKD